MIAREAELATLKAWLAAPDCYVAIIADSGGVAKSALAAALRVHVAAGSDAIAWCSLRDAPPLDSVVRLLH